MFFAKTRLHFIGAAGIGVSGLVELCLAAGCKVSGSDLKFNDLAQSLIARGASLHEGHRAENLPADAEAVVVTTAAKPDNPELVEAQRRGLPIVRRGEMLAEMMRGRRAAVIGGSHGKTTTSAMTSILAVAGGLNPSCFVGGRLPQWNGANARAGAGEWFVTEADESDGSFLELSPEVAVVTNVDREHLDYWKTFEAVEDSFVQFANRTAFYGQVVWCADDEPARRLLPRLRRRVLTYGRSAGARLRILAGESGAEGSRFALVLDGKALGEFSVPALGAHNVLNSTAAIGAALGMGIALEAARDALAGFGGVARRMEVKGRRGGITVVDDYGHHPSEIRATLEALRLTRPGRLVVLFQPHRYTRTRDLLGEFAASFASADVVRITEIYAASEPPLPGISGEAVAQRVTDAGHRNARFSGPLEESARQLAKELKPGDLVVTLGAGSITQAGAWILEERKQ